MSVYPSTAQDNTPLAELASVGEAALNEWREAGKAAFQDMKSDLSVLRACGNMTRGAVAYALDKGNERPDFTASGLSGTKSLDRFRQTTERLMDQAREVRVRYGGDWVADTLLNAAASRVEQAWQDIERSNQGSSPAPATGYEVDPGKSRGAAPFSPNLAGRSTPSGLSTLPSGLLSNSNPSSNASWGSAPSSQPAIGSDAPMPDSAPRALRIRCQRRRRRVFCH